MSLLVAFCAVPSLVLAQGTSVIQGRITDPTGAAVPKARVTATEVNTGLGRSDESGADGYFHIPDLLPGKYTVEASAGGFATAVRQGVELLPGTILETSFKLEMGSVSNTITVEGTSPQLETTVARVSQVVSTQEVESLPVQGRGLLSLDKITPGVIPAGAQDGNAGYCCDAFSNFMAPLLSSDSGTQSNEDIRLDGIDLRYTSGSYWGALFTPNQDAVSEVRVSATPYSPEYGTMSGPVVEIITKGGTNTWHGTGFFTDMEGFLNAAPRFNPHPPATYTRYYGGTVGGPIIKNRLFFYAGYQGTSSRTAQNTEYTVETKQFVNFVETTNPNSNAAAILQGMPLKVYPTTALPNNPYLGNVFLTEPNRRSGWQGDFRLDYETHSGKDRIYAAYWYTKATPVSPGIRVGTDNYIPFWSPSVNLVYTHTFSANVLNELRFGYPQLHWLDYYNTTSAYRFPGITIDQGLSLGVTGIYSRATQRVGSREVGDVITISRGHHMLKAGGNYRLSFNDQSSVVGNQQPTYEFATMLDFANDNPYLESRTISVGGGPLPLYRKYNIMPELAFFVLDTWQVKPNLTLNLGLRWDDFFPQTFRGGYQQWEPIISSNQLTQAGMAQIVDRKVDNYYQNQTTNFGPRVSVAWDPTGRRKISIRGGFGVLYDEINSYPIFDAFNNPWPGGSYSANAGPQFGIPIVYGLGIKGAPLSNLGFPQNPGLQSPGMSPQGGIIGVRANVGGTVQDLQVPRWLDTMAGVQYQATNSLVLEMDYRFRRTTNNILSTNFNRFTGDLLEHNGVYTGLNPYFTNMQLATNDGRGTYHGIVVSASKRFSRGWSLNGSYTYSHFYTNRNAIGDTGDDQYNVVDPWNINNELGRDDLPNVLKVYNVWDLPTMPARSGLVGRFIGGWQFNTIWSLFSGVPFAPYTNASYASGGDYNADGFGYDRPDLPTQNVPRSFSNQAWLNGALNASWFPVPDKATPRVGTLPRDYFRGPGYARIDAALSKDFPLRVRGSESAHLQFRWDAFNVFNRVNLNIGGLDMVLTDATFGKALSAYQNRTMQLSAKFIF